MKTSSDISRTIAVLITFICLYSSVFSAQAQVVGGYGSVSVKDKDVIAAAEFAIKEQGKREKVQLVKLEKAEKQVVAGMNVLLRQSCVTAFRPPR